MGDTSEMMLDGTLCEGCGVVIEGQGKAEGFPRYCDECREYAPVQMLPISEDAKVKIRESIDRMEAKFPRNFRIPKVTTHE